MTIAESFPSLSCAALLLGLSACSALSQTLDATTKFRLAQSLEQAGEIERAASLV